MTLKIIFTDRQIDIIVSFSKQTNVSWLCINYNCFWLTCETISVCDLEKIENKMQELAKAKYQIKRQEWSREKALEFFLKKGEKYKVEIIKKIPK